MPANDSNTSKHFIHKMLFFAGSCKICFIGGPYSALHYNILESCIG